MLSTAETSKAWNTLNLFWQDFYGARKIANGVTFIINH